jgi:hypothetical protein
MTSRLQARQVLHAARLVWSGFPAHWAIWQALE